MTFDRVVFGIALATACVGLSAQSSAFVAGLQPDRRPPHPRITEAPPVDFARMTRGIDGARPEQFAWLSDQGAWFTPFGHPGATDPYDLRGLHAAVAAQAR
jgi:hypothetical protein